VGVYNQAVAAGITRPICIPLVVTTTDLMFRKIFEILWFDKRHVEIDLHAPETPSAYSSHQRWL